nr:glutathione S-transferase C-terminal domain-containing protein [uncultured Devosia sp.]
MVDVVVWGRRNSSNVQAVMWCLEELGLSSIRFDVGHRYGGTDTEEFGRLNPNRTVPVIRHQQVTIWETGAILRFLSSLHGSDTFWPKDYHRRAVVDQWAEWSKINFGPAFSKPVFLQTIAVRQDVRNQVAYAGAISRMDDLLDIAEDKLTKDRFLAGPEFTLADIQFGHLLYRYFDIAIERKTRPALHDYYEGLLGRQAFKQHVVVPYDDLIPTAS